MCPLTEVGSASELIAFENGSFPLVHKTTHIGRPLKKGDNFFGPWSGCWGGVWVKGDTLLCVKEELPKYLLQLRYRVEKDFYLRSQIVNDFS